MSNGKYKQMSEPVDPVTHPELAVENESLAASNEVLGQRVEKLANLLTRKEFERETRKTWWAVWGSYALNILHIIAAAVAVIFGVGYVHAQDQIKALTVCLDETSTQFRDSSVQGRIAADKQADEMISYLNQGIESFETILSPSTSRAQKTKAVADYKQSTIALRDATASAKKTRAEHPLPETNCSQQPRAFHEKGAHE